MAGKSKVSKKQPPVTQNQSAVPGVVGQAPAVQVAQTGAGLPNPLVLPKEFIEMPWVGTARPHSDLGYLRDSDYFWKRYMSLWGEQLSPLNKDRINGLVPGERLPRVDDTWIKFHSQHAAYRDDPIEHHHAGHGSRAVPLPEKLHDAYTLFHARREVLGEGAAPLKQPKPPPTRQRTERENRRQVKEGRLRGPGITTSSPPPIPDIAPSSELATVPPEKRRPVSPQEVADLQRVDPATGKVRGSSPPPSVGGSTGSPPPQASTTRALGQSSTVSVPAESTAASTRGTTSPPMAGNNKTISAPPIEAGAGTPARLSPQRLKAYTGVPDMANIPVGGLSARGGALANGATLGLDLLNKLLNWLNDREQKSRLEEALAQIEPTIRARQAENPQQGAMLFIYYTQVRPHPDSPIIPGPQFRRIELGFGRTPEEALYSWQDTPALRPGLDPGTSERIERLWISPPEPAPVEEIPMPEPPFPIIALATFAGDKPALQEVEWAFSRGFDDEGLTQLSVPTGVEARFFILAVPRTISWVPPINSSRIAEVFIRTRLMPTASGDEVQAVDLDPVNPFGSVTATCIFPADRATADLFATSIGTIGNTSRLGYRNFQYIRWVSPEQIRVLR